MKDRTRRLPLLAVLALASACLPALAADPPGKEPPATGKPAPDKPANEAEPKKLDASTFGVLSARGVGPAMMSGRIGDLAVDPRDASTFYVAACSGGVWKTTSAGASFSPIFDSYGSFSIGCLALDPSNPSTLWVGTGENNSQRSVSWGDGVYVSRDAGGSFTNMGLTASEHIGMIRVDPRDSNTVYAAAMGPLWKAGGDRGLYKTSDGGKTWQRILYISENTGVNEVHLDPRNPDVLYATAYQRRRHVWTLIDGGPESGVYKSTDAGRTWRRIESGLPGCDKGRIGLAVSPVDPDWVYAIVEAQEDNGGVFLSRNHGESWEKRSSYMTTSGQYYNELFADPLIRDRVYAEDTFLHVSDDAGSSFHPVGEPDKHVDNHVVWIDPHDSNHLRVGCDGGLYETRNRRQWTFFPNLPVTQFYRIASDNSLPFYFVYGGTQDNSTLGGPARTTDRVGIANEHWFITTGGDGFRPAIDPQDPDTVYSESQHAGLVRFDRKSGEEVDIVPREKPGEDPYVWTWDTPLIISPHSHTRLYVGSRVVHRSDDRGNSWTVTSPNLTRKIDRNTLKVFDTIQKPEAVAKDASTSIYGNLVSLAESPKAEGLLYAGADDGLISVTEDGGKTWRSCDRLPGAPEIVYVADLEPSCHDANTVFAALDNHKNGDFTPYLYRSDDRGRTWTSISGNLPSRDVCYTVAQDHVNPNLLFVGTEFGCYYTVDAGAHWFKVAGLPTIAVRDIEIQRRESDLVMGTFGRGIYILDDYSPLRDASDSLLAEESHIFPVRPALSYVERARLGGGGRGTQGASYFNAPNPPFGATITYYLKTELKSLRDQRKEAQKKPGWTYPTIEQFRAEDRQAEPHMLMLIRDQGGRLLRQLDLPEDAGIHRITWNLRLPPTTPIQASRRDEEEDPDLVGNDRGGTLVPPGTYTAQLATLVAGVTTPMGSPVSFEIKDLDQATFGAKGEVRKAKFEFEIAVNDLNRAVSGASSLIASIEDRIASLRQAAASTPGIDPGVFADLESLRLRARDIRIQLQGDPTLGAHSEPAQPGIAGRIGEIVYPLMGTTQPPTGTQREQYDVAATLFERTLTDLRVLAEQDMPAMERRLEAAGSPWTPGRVPDWKRR